jgi:Xaa-Pro aminopeptidase
METYKQHYALQAIAKAVLSDLAGTLVHTDTEQTIADRAATMLASHGVTETWYYACPALVLLGSRSCLSVSGRDYSPSSEKIGLFNLVTVDLSPLQNGIWADCARSFFIENGVCVQTPSSKEFLHGLNAEQELHRAMQAFVTPTTSFEELFRFANSAILQLGFKNLDFLGNVGHSIESNRGDRRYIEAGNAQLLGDSDMFTFEPHISATGFTWGFKHENIYYFSEDGHATEL